ncbi:MAG: hypothetical protein EP341_09985 [Sphingomonadales bacterium]|nr:MAG: hypothetical protein EP341_09985 [Sphingomonadales bacterium]
MLRGLMLGGAALALGATLAVAQESLLPPGFDDPVPTPTPTQTAAPDQNSEPGTAVLPGEVVQPLPGAFGPAPDLSQFDFSTIPTIEELQEMTPEDLDELFGLRPGYDIPAAARRSMERVGLIAIDEGGLPAGSLARQPAGLVRAILEGLDGPVVSRWGHILLRRALVSRLESPEGMSPVEFAGLRAQALNGMGEYGITRALVQDVDTGNWDERLIDNGLQAYLANNDIIGACPMVRFTATGRDDAEWELLRAICNSYAGEAVLGGAQLDRALRSGSAPRIDVLFAQRLAGAAGRGRRAVDIEWDDVDELTPWRFALANAVGEEVPEGLRSAAGPYYQRVWASSTMLPLALRAQNSFRAGREGIFSSRAMVDLFGQIYADETIVGEEADTASRLREAYVGSDPQARLAAMQEVWGGDVAEDYGRYVLTAYAAARIPASADYVDEAPSLLASMLAAGLDRDAAAWARVVNPGSEGWALIALAGTSDSFAQSSEAIDGFVDDDDSGDNRKSRFLIAGLAGLDRISAADRQSFSERLSIDLGRQSRWTRAISRAADVNNRALVAMLAGLGMQGEGWDRMTALHLYHIVSALNRVGFEAEARMIAAEAVARG